MILILFFSHVHPGHETCTKCEPGLVIASKPKYNISSQMDSKDRDEKRKSKLKEIREKYGITSSQELEVGSNYKDRADERRKTKGSDHGNFFQILYIYEMLFLLNFMLLSYRFI